MNPIFSEARHARRELCPKKRLAAAPIRTCWPANVKGVGLVACRAPLPTLSPVARRGFSFWNQPPPSELSRCGTLRNHSALYPSKLGPASAGPFLSERDLTEQQAPPTRGVCFDGLGLVRCLTIHRDKESPGRAGAFKETSHASRDQGAPDAPILSQGTNHARRGSRSLLLLSITLSPTSCYGGYPLLYSRRGQPGQASLYRQMAHCQ